MLVVRTARCMVNDPADMSRTVLLTVLNLKTLRDPILCQVSDAPKDAHAYVEVSDGQEDSHFRHKQETLSM